MAIYHLSTKPISRSSGRSAVASIAYRAGIKIEDERLGKTYDYTKRNGVLWVGMATPQDFEIDRSELWNKAEKTETRSNSRTAREIVIHIPHELMNIMDNNQNNQFAGTTLAHEFAKHLSQKYQIAVDVAVHAPDKTGDERNFHAHLLLTTRIVEQTQDGSGSFNFGKKSQLEMSNAQLKQLGLLSNQDELKEIRREWAEFANQQLAKYGIDERIDHRSHTDRGLETLPTVKMGWQATELERQGIQTEVGDYNRAVKAHNAEIQKRNQLRKQVKKHSEQHKQQDHQTQEDSLKNTQKTEKKVPVLENSTQNTENTIQNTSQNAQNEPKTAIKKQSDRYIAHHNKTTLKTQNKTTSKPYSENSENTENEEQIDLTKKTPNQLSNKASNSNLLSPEQHQQTLEFLRTFNQRIEHIAQQILNNQLKTLQNQAKIVLAKIEQLKENKPLFFGKDQWQKDKQQALAEYNAIKEQHDRMRDTGITVEHRKQASEQLSQQDLNYHKQGTLAFLQIKLHEQQLKQEQQIQQEQADVGRQTELKQSSSQVPSQSELSKGKGR